MSGVTTTLEEQQAKIEAERIKTVPADNLKACDAKWEEVVNILEADRCSKKQRKKARELMDELVVLYGQGNDSWKQVIDAHTSLKEEYDELEKEYTELSHDTEGLEWSDTCVSSIGTQSKNFLDQYNLDIYKVLAAEIPPAKLQELLRELANKNLKNPEKLF